MKKFDFEVLKEKSLKKGLCANNNLSHKPVEMRYIIENYIDMAAYIVAFPNFDFDIVKNHISKIWNQEIVLLLKEPSFMKKRDIIVEDPKGICRANNDIFYQIELFNKTIKEMIEGKVQNTEIFFNDTLDKKDISCRCFIKADGSAVIVPHLELAAVIPIRYTTVDYNIPFDIAEEIFKVNFGSEYYNNKINNDYPKDFYYRSGLHTFITTYDI